MNRIYVCHTYYHVFVAILKEFNFYKDDLHNATIVLSKMSNDFGNLGERLERSGIFREIVYFDEKRYTEFPELEKYKIDHGNIVLNLINRIIFTKKFGRYEEAYIPVDFKKYDEIFVFCDTDPIGYYLNYKRIKYHAVEDGLDTLRDYIQAKYDNRGAWKLKKFMSLYLNLIFMCDGYSKYAIDMEVNDISILNDSFSKYIEVPRNAMIEALSTEEKEKIVSVFVNDIDRVYEIMGNKETGKKAVMILTEPLCSLDVRERLFADLINEYSLEGTVFIKPHPRDELDYEKLFPNEQIFDKKIPMEMFRLMSGIRFDKVVSIFTHLEAIDFADEKVFLGCDFMDKYEAPEVHRKKETIEGTL